MKVEEVHARVGDVPYMRPREARIFHDLIVSQRLSSALELGFLHGVSSAYIAGALEEAGGGRLTTIDLVTARDRQPSIEQLLERCGLSHQVEIFYEPKTFNWRLMRFLERRHERQFDICYIDGGHTWTDTGFAFCLVKLLLKPGGWVIFDDLPHTFRDSSSRDASWVRRMTEEEQTTPQVDNVFRLLVTRDAEFHVFRRINSLGIARKRDEAAAGSVDLQLETAICGAVERARTDPWYRQLLLCDPDRAVTLQTPRPENASRRIRFEESGLWCPLPPEYQSDGTVTHFLENPDWRIEFSESELEEMMRS